jgi:hypothetical protein
VSVGPSVEGQPVADPFAEFLVYDGETELVYATEDEDESASSPWAPVDANKLAVPRSVLYMQGILIGTVALMGFTLGILVGAGTSGRRDNGDDQPQPCLISGVIGVQNETGETHPDVGAVAIVVPRDQHPEQKAELFGLRPQDPRPNDDHAGLQVIRSLGGDYARADADGRYQLKVPDAGDYFLLVISAGSERNAEDQPKAVLAQIGRFFQLSADLFGGRAYQWQEETVRRDRQLNVVFP